MTRNLTYYFRGGVAFLREHPQLWFTALVAVVICGAFVFVSFRFAGIATDAQEQLFNDRPYIVLTNAKNIQAFRSDRFTGFGTETGDILWKSALLQAEPVK
jgi:hypothetical protein